MKRIFKVSGLLMTAAATVSPCVAATVFVTNPSPFGRSEVVEVKGEMLGGLTRTPFSTYLAISADGDTLQTQLTHSGTLLFKATVPAGAKKAYEITEGTPLPSFYPQAHAAVYPYRDDDLSWENDLVGFRAYGPAKRTRGERLYGYDLWLKRGTDRLTLPTLYGMDSNPENWARVDSLRKIDNTLAEDFIKTFSYHVDHGLGMDCYAVGPTLGACTAAPVDPSTGGIVYPWNYQHAEIMDNGPLRVTMRLTYPPVVVGGDTLTERRLIILDAGSRLNRTEVAYDGMTRPLTVLTGIVLHDDSPVMMESGMIAYSDPTQGPDNGRILLGAINPSGFEKREVIESNGYRQLTGSNTVRPGETHRYLWGFSWTRNGLDNPAAWQEYLKRILTQAPLTVTAE